MNAKRVLQNPASEREKDLFKIQQERVHGGSGDDVKRERVYIYVCVCFRSIHLGETEREGDGEESSAWRI